MDRVNNYLLSHFISLFSSLFFILFSIISVIFLIKIASVTSVIQMNFVELVTLYIYLIPKLLLYTMPVTFFIALCITLFNLSKENELIVLFTLGYSPSKVAKFFLILGFLFSAILIVNVLILIPLSKQLNKNFIDYKKAEAKFNIQESKFGQKFSGWIVYIDKVDEDKKEYKNIALYKKRYKNEFPKLILSKQAAIKNDNGILRLVLNNGKAFEFQDKKIVQVDFDKMYINTKNSENIGYMQTIYDYWNFAFKDKKRAYDFAFFILIALFPFVTIYMAMGISTVTSRYSKNSIYIYIFMTVLLYFLAVSVISKTVPFSSIAIISFFTYLISYIVYKKRVASRF